MDDESCAASTENRMFIVAERDIGRYGRHMRCPVRADDQHEIGDIPSGSPGVAVAAFKVRTGRCKVWRFTFSDLVNVDRVLAWRQILDIQDDLDAFGRGRKRGGSHALPLRVLDDHDHGLAC